MAYLLINHGHFNDSNHIFVFTEMVKGFDFFRVTANSKLIPADLT